MGFFQKRCGKQGTLHRERVRLGGGEGKGSGSKRPVTLSSKPCRWTAAFAENQVELGPIQANFHMVAATVRKRLAIVGILNRPFNDY